MGSGGIRRSGISAPGPSSDGWITKHRQLNPGVYEIGASPTFVPRLVCRLAPTATLATRSSSGVGAIAHIKARTNQSEQANARGEIRPPETFQIVGHSHSQ